MTMFSFNDNPVVVPVEATEEPTEATEEPTEALVDEYAGISEEDYATADEPDFGDDV
jgi:hypothetical protein